MDETPELPTTESVNPAAAALGQLDGRGIAALMNAEDRRTVEAVASQLDALGAAIEAIAERMRRGGRLLYVGAGTSGRLGVLDASECPPTFGTDPAQVQGVIAGGPEALLSAREGAEDDGEQAVRDLEARDLGPLDCVVGISASGRTPYPRAAVVYARAKGAYTVGLCCNEDAPLAREAEQALCLVVGPEVLAGSTRLKAGTVTKMALNMLSTGAMVRLGRTHGPHMSGLRPGSAKLRQRAVRILCEVGGLGEEAGRERLEAHGGDLRRALEGLAGDRPPATVVHLARPDWWQRVQGQPSWRPDSLDTEGFVHCSTPAQLEATAARHFSRVDEVVLLILDPAALGEALVFEDTSGHGVFPHVYGPIPRAALRRTLRWRRDPGGVFRCPAELAGTSA